MSDINFNIWVQHATKVTMVLFIVYVFHLEENHMPPDPRMEPLEFGRQAQLLMTTERRGGQMGWPER